MPRNPGDYTRTRSDNLPARTELKFSKVVATTNGVITEDSGGYYGSPIITHIERRKTTQDVVVPKYFSRIKAGELFNNPYETLQETFNVPLAPYRYEYWSGTYVDGELEEKGYLKVISGTDVIDLPLFSPLDHPQNMIDNAITDAYAGISANEGNTLLWLGEFKETLKMLRDIGTGLKALYDKTKKQRLKWAQGKLSIPEQQKLTLAIVFGILPLEQSIADFMEGLFRTKDNETRHTSRGFRLKSTSRNGLMSGTQHDYRGTIDQITSYTEYTDIVVRAGVLYEIDVTDLPWISIIADPKAVVSTAYALTRMSFVADWFMNIGGTLAAWSPSFGTNEILAYVSVEITQQQVGQTHYTLSNPSSTEYVDDQERTQWDRSRYEKYRYPISRADLAIFPRFDIDLDLEQIALLVLLFAKIRKQ